MKTTGEDQQLLEVRRKLKRLMEESSAEVGPDYVWNRADIYGDRMPLHQHPDSDRSGKKG